MDSEESGGVGIWKVFMEKLRLSQLQKPTTHTASVSHISNNHGDQPIILFTKVHMH